MKKINQFDLNMNFIKEWNSIKDILKVNPTYNRSPIANCLNNRIMSTYNFKWKFSRNNKEYFSFPFKTINEDGNVELWIDIYMYEGKYQLSNLGRVYSIKTEKFLKISSKDNDYDYVMFDKKKYSIHRLLAIHFIENEKNNYNIINHIDHNKKNKDLNNLEWTDAKGNAQAYQKFKSKRPILQYNKDCKNLIKEWRSIEEILNKYPHYIKGSLEASLYNRVKTVYGFHWKYKDGYKIYTEPEQIKDEIFINIGIINDIDYSLYEISNYGRIKNTKTKKNIKITVRT